MGNDDDLAQFLPDPPPPRPAAREATIEAAMRRFDRVPEPEAAPASPRQRNPAWRTRRGQIGAFASILLVALVGIPIALLTPGPKRPPPAVEQSAPPAQRMPAAEAESTLSEPAKPNCAGADCARPAPERPVAAAIPAPAVQPMAPAPAESVVLADTQAVSPPASAAAAPAQPKMARRAEAVAEPTADVSAVPSRWASPAAAPAAPPPVIAEDVGGFDDRSVVVTATRTNKASAAMARRGDWNACTVADPARSLSGCKALINPDAKGATGEAATHLSDGLDLAWRGDWKGAIAAFDQAIARRPHFAFAWLNRGMAWQHAGDSTRAIADLDRAIRYAPTEPRGFYQRSLVRRAQGEKKRADADAQRAGELDPAYAALIE